MVVQAHAGERREGQRELRGPQCEPLEGDAIDNIRASPITARLAIPRLELHATQREFELLVSVFQENFSELPSVVGDCCAWRCDDKCAAPHMSAY